MSAAISSHIVSPGRSQQRQQQGDVDNGRRLGYVGPQQQRRDAASTQQLRGHHTVGPGRSTHNANHTERDHCEHEAGRELKEFSHCWDRPPMHE